PWRSRNRRAYPRGSPAGTPTLGGGGSFSASRDARLARPRGEPPQGRAPARRGAPGGPPPVSEPRPPGGGPLPPRRSARAGGEGPVGAAGWWGRARAARPGFGGRGVARAMAGLAPRLTRALETRLAGLPESAPAALVLLDLAEAVGIPLDLTRAQQQALAS